MNIVKLLEQHGQNIMKRIIAVIFSVLSFSTHAAVVGAGDLRWEKFFENENRTMKYSLDSVSTYARRYEADVWIYTEFKQPVFGKFTENADNEQVKVKYIFQRLIMFCDKNTYTQTELFAFRWDDEANVGHLMTNENYNIKARSPMETLRGIVCNMKRMY